jgi:prepilin-type N-terminal cleavage/methylation domain-containing protein
MPADGPRRNWPTAPAACARGDAAPSPPPLRCPFLPFLRSPLPCARSRRRLGAHAPYQTAGRRRGFTLIELLVVIAVIALLMGVLLPALSRARGAAIKVWSQSNMRTIHQWMHIYASTYDDQVPVGYRGERCQWNTMVYSGTNNLYVLYGRLVLEDLVETGEALYSPAETAPDQSHNTPQNPWPPGQPGVNVQGGYALAPLVDWGYAGLPERLPRLSALGSQAILADSFGVPERVDTRHRDGIHALHADAAVRWVRRERFDDLLSQCTSISPEHNDTQRAIWDRLNNVLPGPDNAQEPAAPSGRARALKAM